MLEKKNCIESVIYNSYTDNFFSLAVVFGDEFETFVLNLHKYESHLSLSSINENTVYIHII